MGSETSKIVSAALHLAAQGFRVLPLAGKVARLSDWPNRATTDPKKIEQFFLGSGIDNVGILTGCGFFVVDIDPRHGGAETLQRLELQHGSLPDTVVAHTGGGGYHLYYLAPEPIRSSPGRPGPRQGLDLKGVGGYVVAPPSIHPDSGRAYSWVLGRAPWETFMSTPPEWLLEVLGASSTPTLPLSPARITIPQGERNTTLLIIAGRCRARGKDTAEILEVLRRANRACNPPLVDRDLVGIARNIGAKTPGVVSYDLSLSRRFVRENCNDCRYVVGFDWVLWGGERWERDSKGVRALGLASSTVTRMIDDALLCPTKEDYRREIAVANRAESAAKQAAMLLLAKSSLLEKVETFDAQPWIFNTRSGTVDLKSGALHLYKRSDFLTKLSSFVFDLSATAPKWEVFLSTVFGCRAGLILSVQEAVGYSLTGVSAEQCFFILSGSGQNGKSVFLAVLGKLFGEYAQTARFDSFLTDRKKIGSPRNDLAEMRGVRLISAIESPEGASLDEITIKALTGGEPIRARHLYCENVEFTPQAKIWLATNHRPEIHGTDHAIWRRVRVIPFDVVISEDQRRPFEELVGELVAEGAGILNWALEGLRRYLERGKLEESEEIRDATAKYKEDEDRILRFLEDNLEYGPDFWISSKDLYQRYRVWIKDQGEQPKAINYFGVDLKSANLHPEKKNNRNGWRGIRLKNDQGFLPAPVTRAMWEEGRE